MTPAKIQYELKIRGITQKQIAKDLDKSEMAVSKEINGIRTSEAVRRAIAKAIDCDPKSVFPDYYFRVKKRKARNAA